MWVSIDLCLVPVGVGVSLSRYIRACKEIIESTGASSLKDMGKIMGLLKQKYSDSIDFSKANLIIKGLLSQ